MIIFRSGTKSCTKKYSFNQIFISECVSQATFINIANILI